MVKTMQSEITEKEKCLKKIQIELDAFKSESNETKQRLENELKKVTEDYEQQSSLDRSEFDLTIETIKKEKDSKIKQLTRTIDTLKSDTSRTVADLNEQIKMKQSENQELLNRIKECEETLAKDKDERIQRLVDTQRTLEKEIESLKAALDIKSGDLSELRTKNNELITKLDDYNELNARCRRYKQELEQTNAILANKQEADRKANEEKIGYINKLEVKTRENQRLSMQNEQLQFRLQSHPNLSINGLDSFNASNSSISQYDEQMASYIDQNLTTSKCKRSSTMREPSSSTNESCMDSAAEDQVNALISSPKPPVKLRSKSFKTQQSCNLEQKNKKISLRSNFRPQSEYRPEMYEVNIIDRDTLMTRSYTATSTSSRHIVIDSNEDNLDTTIDISNDANSARCVSSSSSSSISHLDNHDDQNQMIKSCSNGLKVNDNESAKLNDEKNLKKFINNDNSLSSSSSINDNSVICLD
jgi:DNA repair exonuclease SbcCD ATPase subunit